MNTFINLARKRGALETIDLHNAVRSQNWADNQIFKYLLVLDLEATCWEKNDPSAKSNPEVIEFPLVLFDVINNKIVSEFQQYVKPTENPTLSPFCTQLTGIKQIQVDNGVPLRTCFLLLHKWLQHITQTYRLDFPPSNNERTVEMRNACAVVTWSDWDLGTCLANECFRKKLLPPSIFLRWIDLRAIFKVHYSRPLNGLVGALTQLGLKFEGNPHCGLHDARNTALLAGRMARNGTPLRLTKF